MRTPRDSWKKLSTEAVNPKSARLDRAGIERIVALMQSEDRRVLKALLKARPAIIRAAELFRATWLAGRTSFLFGAGTSGRLAVLEAAELPPTFGTDPRRVVAIVAGGRSAVFRATEGAEDRRADGVEGARRVRSGDLVIGVSASSVTPFVRGALAVTSESADGAETQLRVLRDGDYFGEVALLRNVPRTATVRTLVPTTLLSLQRAGAARERCSSPPADPGRRTAWQTWSCGSTSGRRSSPDRRA